VSDYLTAKWRNNTMATAKKAPAKKAEKKPAKPAKKK